MFIFRLAAVSLIAPLVITLHATPRRNRGPFVQTAGVIARLDGLPLRFEPNQGQTAPPADFIARGPGYSIRLQSGEAALEVAGRGLAATPLSDSVRMRLLGARPSAAHALDPLETISSYFIGPDPAKWRTGIRNYARVCYSGVYRGVDLCYYGNRDRLEYDFVLAPGADTGAIVLGFEGVEKIGIDTDGDLLLGMRHGNLRQQRPICYQWHGTRKVSVRGRYHLLSSNRVGFLLENYDRSRALVIDPALTYSTYVGGTGWDEGVGLAVDSRNNVYVAGWTTSKDLPARGLQVDLGGGEKYGDAFVFKLNSAGTSLAYCTYLGGSKDERAWGVVVDSAGSAYVTGVTESADYPVTSDALQPRLRGQSAAFLAKLSPNGTKLTYSTYLGGSQAATGLALALDRFDSVYVTGSTTSTDFPTTAGAHQTVNHGSRDVFVTKFDRSAAMVYSTLIGGSGEEWANAIALDLNGFAYLTGYTQSPDFPTTAGAFQRIFRGGLGDCFVTKINALGTALVYSTLLATASDDFGRAIAVDRGGNAYIGGRTGSADFPVTRGAFQTRFGGVNDGFVSKLNAAGSALLYSTFLGGSASDQIEGLDVDSTGAVHIVGISGSKDFPVTRDALQALPRGAQTGTLTKLSPDGSALIYSSYMGGSGGIDAGIGAAADKLGNTYVMGYTNSEDFSTTKNAFQRSFKGGSGHVFVLKVDYAAQCSYSLTSKGKSFSGSGGSATIGVTAGDGCPWAATAAAPWVTITSGAGIGNGLAAFTVSSNPGIRRSSYVRIGGGKVTIMQRRGGSAN